MFRKIFEDFDWFIFLPSLFLCLFSILIIQSVALELVPIHVLTIIAGFILFIVFSLIDYRVLESLGNSFYALSVISLLITFLIGLETRGSLRWIEVGLIRIQPSELIKPLLIVFFANRLSFKSTNIKRNVINIILFAIPTILVFKQPDLGNAVIYTLIFLGILYLSGIKVRTIIVGIISMFFLMPAVWFFLKDYQKQRVITFLNPLSDPLGAGYNSFQASIAVGSGELWGRGLGWGTQSHLKFLPEFHTDFVFASLSEELGLFGASIMLFLYLVILVRLIQIAKSTPNRPSTLIILGIFIMILSQVFINIGMNIGIVPITGITLPLVSYGNNSILATLISLGIASSISRTSVLSRIKRPVKNS